jgi:hypothetical protein
MNKFIAGTYAYGFVRSIAYAPPMKKDEYLIDRISKVMVYTSGSPLLFPVFIYIDLKNLEHVVRKMPGPIDRRFSAGTTVFSSEDPRCSH